LTLARNLVLGNTNDHRIWPEGGGFPHRASQFATKFVLILKRLCDLEFSAGHFFRVRFSRFSNNAAGKLRDCAKLPVIYAALSCAAMSTFAGYSAPRVHQEFIIAILPGTLRLLA
jgi:hypothetical protein